VTQQVSTLPDRTPPKLLGAFSYGDSIHLTFSEPLAASGITTLSNYTISSPVSVTSAALRGTCVVVLKTNSFSSLADSLIFVKGLSDMAQTPNAIVRDSIPVVLVRGFTISTGKLPKWFLVDTLCPFNYDDKNRIIYSRPDSFANFPYFSNSLNDVVDAGVEYMSFSVNRAVNVVVGANHLRPTPQWLAGDGWVQTGEFFSEYDIYQKRFEAGKISLKGCGLETDPYMVVLRPAEYTNTTKRENNALSGTITAPGVLVYPQPFSSKVLVRVSGTGESPLSVQIIDIKGRLIKSLKPELGGSGPRSFTWDGRDVMGTRMANGIYLCRILQPGHAIRVERLLMVK